MIWGNHFHVNWGQKNIYWQGEMDDLFEEIIGNSVVITERNSIIDVNFARHGADINRRFVRRPPHYPTTMGNHRGRENVLLLLQCDVVPQLEMLGEFSRTWSPLRSEHKGLTKNWVVFTFYRRGRQ